jgi:cysteine desulfurase
LRKVYLDYAASSPADPRVVSEMLPYFTEIFANPLAVHDYGKAAAVALNAARESIAGFLGAKTDEIIFTSGGTESNNTAIKGVAFAAMGRKDHIITSPIEHRAVLAPCKFLEKFGFNITYLNVDSTGMVDPDDVRRAITPKTALISVMHANNEIGTIQPVAEIGRIARENGVPFHSDAVQTVGHIPVNVDALNVDLLSASGHKLYGPKGVGVLYIRNNTKLNRFMHGGSQEKSRRASTHNVPGIVGIGKAFDIASEEISDEILQISTMQDRLITGILSCIEGVQLNGHPSLRLPGNINISFKEMRGSRLLQRLNEEGIYCSTGSACSARNVAPSHVLTAIGVPFYLIEGSVRLTLGKFLTDEDIDYALEVLPRIVGAIRA